MPGPCAVGYRVGILLLVALGVFSVQSGEKFRFSCKKNRDRSRLAKAAYDVGKEGRCGYISTMIQEKLYDDKKRIPSFKMIFEGHASVTWGCRSVGDR